MTTACAVTTRAMRAATLFLTLLVASSAAGCGSTPPSSFYLLGTLPPAASGVQQGDPSDPPASEWGAEGGTQRLALGVGPVRLPGYLRGAEIATRSTEGGIRYEAFRRWAEPLDTRFAAVLAENLSERGDLDVLLQPWIGTSLDVQLVVDVVAFEVVDDGRYLLTARWALLEQPGGGERTRERFHAESPVDPADFTARTRVGTELLEQLSSAIGAAIGDGRPLDEP